VSGDRRVELSRPQLLAGSLVTADLPIACVEGWSTLQRWTGVRLHDLARLVGAERPTGALVESMQKGGAFGRVSLSGQQVRAAQSLLALKVNGADLSLDHGYPARVIVPAAPGVHNTKWVDRITFQNEALS
jgi:DMSO/TMAO reductase YedYZ molybdopterin-dependent catalytic subunit